MNTVHMGQSLRSSAGAIIDASARGGDLELDADVVIVGTGAGGAVAARVLAERGFSVVALEEGAHVTAKDHGAMRPTESLRHVWRDGGLTFTVPVGDSPVINVTMGKVVGGSSMVTGGVCLRPPPEVTHRWRTERGLAMLTEAALEPHLGAVEKWTGVSRVPDEMRSLGVQRFGEGLERLHGVGLESLHRNTEGCEGLGRCNFGCPRQHKLSVDLSVIPRAQERGATVVSGALVERILMRGTRARGVVARAGANKVTVHAPRVVVAAGSWHGPLLLSRSGLKSRHLGRHMTLHPSFRMMGRMKEPVRGWEGALQSAYSPHFMGDGLTLVSLFIPPGPIAGVLPGFGPELMRRAGQLDRIAMMGCLFHDEGGGRVFGLPGAREPVVSYALDRAVRLSFPRVVRQVAEIFFAAGADEVYAPILHLPPLTPDTIGKVDLGRYSARSYEATSQHPLGTCRMGVRPDESVVDPRGRVWGTDNVWVADGSIIPTSLGVNPQVTVMAMAHRVASLMP